MLQETVYERTKVGLLRKGFYYIRTIRAVWGKVKIVSRDAHHVRIFYTVVKRYRNHGKWKIHNLRCIEDLPVHTIIEARRYCK